MSIWNQEKFQVITLNFTDNKVSVVSISGYALSILSIGVTIFTTVNFGIYWTYHLPAGAHYYPGLGINILLCLSLIVFPIVFLVEPVSILSKTYLVVAIFLITFFISGFLYLFDMFDNSTSLFVFSFLLNLMLLFPTVFRSRYLRRSGAVPRSEDI